MNSLIIHTACRASNKMSSNNNLEFTSLREQLLNERSRKEILDFHYKVWRQIENSKSLHMNYKKLKELVNPHLITIIYKGGIFSVDASLEFEYERDGRNIRFSPKHIIQHVIIESSVVSLPDLVFKEWICLRKVSFQKQFSLESIGEQAFEWCLSLNYINLPTSVISIGLASFYCCVSLSK